MDDGVAQARLAINNPDIVLDLQRFNGKPDSTIFNDFWRELETYLDEINPAIERRHGEMLHMPSTVSLCHLHEIIDERLRQKFPEATSAIPSRFDCNSGLQPVCK